MKIPTLDKDFQIVIPTHGRASLSRQKTWRSLPPSLREQTLIITSTKSDMKELRRVLSHEHVYCLGDPSVDGIAKKRQWIIENIKADYIFQLDDDLVFQRRCPKRMRFLNEKGMWEMKPKFKDKVKFIEVNGFTDKQKEHFWDIFRARILDNGYAHGGLGPRMGNNTSKDEYQTPGRLTQAMCHHRKTLLKRGIRFDSFRFREDFHVTISLLKAGYPNLVSHKFIVNADPFGMSGGCYEERTIKASDKDAKRLAKKHAPFVKAVERKYKDMIRTEVVCYWQKAYNSAKRQDRYV